MTFRNDSLRNTFDGIYLALIQSLFLLVAIKYYQVPDLLSSLISAAKSAGFFSALFISAFLATSRRRKATLAAIPTLAGGLFICLAGLIPGALPYTLFTSLALIVINSRPPLFTAIYEENYQVQRRGKLFSLGVLCSYISAIISGFLLMQILEQQLANFRPTLIICGLLFALSSLFIRRIPSSPPNLAHNQNPIKNLGVIFQYPRFGLMLLSWFIVGFANLWTIPIQMVHLAESQRGLDLPAYQVVLISGVIPFTTRLLFNRFWAKLFDHLNFVVLRIILNLLLGCGLLLFFISRQLPLIIAGTILQNIALAGGSYAWNLWVLKFAPPGKSQLFMSIHTFLTGVRGLVGPYLGFLFIGAFSIPRLGITSFGMILLASLLMCPLLRRSRLPAEASG